MAKQKQWKQGLFKPLNPDKYKGNVNNIMLRSSWEFNFAKFLDGNKNVVEWASEEFAVVYYNPVKKRSAQYYPDFWVKYIDKDGETIVEVIEIKPSNQVTRPKKQSGNELATWVQNMAKWEAAIEFCKKRDMRFRVLTEKALFKR